MSKHIELAKKIKALADKGVGGEKINAQKMLDELLKKHNITIEDIEGEKQHDYFFNIKIKDFQLFNQIVKRVNYKTKIYGEFTKKKIKELRLNGNFLITCTASEYIWIESMLSVYLRLYKEELDVFYKAFCKANNLLVNTPDNKSISDLTKEELEKWKRTDEMATKIKSEHFRKQLTIKNP